jgi:hypothetical protein
MYARIDFSQNIAGNLRYHELKVKKEIAECLFAGNAVKDLHELNRKDKLYHFQRLNVMNDKVMKNTLHISLNFHPSEKLSNSQMQAISLDYLFKMRLDGQPFLAYRHYDTVHPHLHIVCTNIRKNGSKLELVKSDFYKSKEVTKDLGKIYSLIPFKREMLQEEWVRLYPLQKVKQGDMALYPNIDRVLRFVIEKYKFASLPELNAVLSLYNIKASRGEKNGYIYEHNGLVYRAVQENKNVHHRYITASSFKSKPTLKNLEKKFELNLSEPRRPKDQQRVTVAIDWTLAKSALPLSAFKKALENERISVVLQQDKEGALQNIHYVDHQTKSVFDGATLGGRYTAAAMRERCLPELTAAQQLMQQKNLSQQQRHDQEHELDL